MLYMVDGTVSEFFLHLDPPDHEYLAVPPAAIVVMRGPRDHGHYSKNVHCLVYTVDGKIVPITEECSEVEKLIMEKRNVNK